MQIFSPFPAGGTRLFEKMFCVIMLAMAGIGCSEQTTNPGSDVEPTFSSISQKIFPTNCATSSCHGMLGQRGGLILEGEGVYERLVNATPTTLAAINKGMKLVVPGKPDSSFLLTKLIAPEPIEGERMPSSNEALSSQQINAIRTWIANGAKRD